MGLRLILATLVLLAQPSGNAVAEDLLGLYVGGAIGRSRVEATTFAYVFPGLEKQNFDEGHAAFKVMLGARPISLLGAEIDYIDFGKPKGDLYGYPANASINGVAAFGILYLPVPIVDVYVKAGLARLESTVNGASPSPLACGFQGCADHFQFNRTNTSGAGGVGAQYKFGSWAVRAEYERFNAAGGNPSLLSAGITWTFL
jgi:Outer membrane protein beta-barrel domain